MKLKIKKGEVILMLDGFRTQYTEVQRSELMQYCKMEDVLLIAVVRSVRPVSALKLQLETAAFHLLQHITFKLNQVSRRLTADIEHKSRAQGYLS